MTADDTHPAALDPKKMSRAKRHLKKDHTLAKVIKMAPGAFDITPSADKYQAITKAIITQQLSGHSAGAISSRFKALYKTPYPRPDDVAKTPHSKLKKTGLSIRKAECIKDVSQMIVDGQISLEKAAEMPDEEIIKMLTQVRGIGRWTAEVFLMFGLGRMDVLPAGDLGLRKGIMKFYNLAEMPSEDMVREIAKAWSPYRTMATWYIWKAQ